HRGYPTDNQICQFSWFVVGSRVGRFPSMNVSLTPELEQYVTDKVESGLYHSASEVVREGLRLLRGRDELHQRKLEGLRREIRVGIEQADRGELGPLDAKGTLERVRARRGRKG